MTTASFTQFTSQGRWEAYSSYPQVFPLSTAGRFVIVAQTANNSLAFTVFTVVTVTNLVPAVEHEAVLVDELLTKDFTDAGGSVLDFTYVAMDNSTLAFYATTVHGPSYGGGDNTAQVWVGSIRFDGTGAPTAIKPATACGSAVDYTAYNGAIPLNPSELLVWFFLVRPGAAVMIVVYVFNVGQGSATTATPLQMMDLAAPPTYPTNSDAKGFPIDVNAACIWWSYVPYLNGDGSPHVESSFIIIDNNPQVLREVIDPENRVRVGVYQDVVGSFSGARSQLIGEGELLDTADYYVDTVSVQGPGPFSGQTYRAMMGASSGVGAMTMAAREFSLGGGSIEYADVTWEVSGSETRSVVTLDSPSYDTSPLAAAGDWNQAFLVVGIDQTGYFMWAGALTTATYTKKLAGANFYMGNLGFNDWSNIDFSGANYYLAAFPGCKFDGSNMENGNWDQGDLSNCTFLGCSFTGKDQGGLWCDFAFSDFTGVDFSAQTTDKASGFYGADFTGAKMLGVNLINRDMQYTVLWGTDFTGATFGGDRYSDANTGNPNDGLTPIQRQFTQCVWDETTKWPAGFDPHTICPPTAKLDYSGQTFTGIDFSPDNNRNGRVFAHGKFINTVFRDCTLPPRCQFADFTGAQFLGTTLANNNDNVDMSHCKMQHTTWDLGSTLPTVRSNKFAPCLMVQADLTGAHFIDSLSAGRPVNSWFGFYEVTAPYLTFRDTTKQAGLQLGFYEGNYAWGDFTNADLTDAAPNPASSADGTYPESNFAHSTFTNTKGGWFVACNMANSTFQGADLRVSSFYQGTVAGCDLTGATVTMDSFGDSSLAAAGGRTPTFGGGVGDATAYDHLTKFPVSINVAGATNAQLVADVQNYTWRSDTYYTFGIDPYQTRYANHQTADLYHQVIPPPPDNSKGAVVDLYGANADGATFPNGLNRQTDFYMCSASGIKFEDLSGFDFYLADLGLPAPAVPVTVVYGGWAIGMISWGLPTLA